MFEVNGNLDGIKNFDNFFSYIMKIYKIFVETFGYETMTNIDLYIDNATENSGYTPIITVILKKYITIKLGISNFSESETIVFQFAHELCHYVFFSLKGLDKEFADDKEENICTAMSLITINRLFPNNINYWINYVNGLSEQKYNKGALIASECNFDIMILKNKIYQMCNDNVLTHI